MKSVQPAAVSSTRAAQATARTAACRTAPAGVPPPPVPQPSGCMRMRLRFGVLRSIAGGADRHGDTEVGARKLTVDDLHRTAVRRDELEHHRQPDAGALDGGAPGSSPGVERIEYMSAILERDA